MMRADAFACVKDRPAAVSRQTSGVGYWSEVVAAGGSSTSATSSLANPLRRSITAKNTASATVMRTLTIGNSHETPKATK
jgi:hypothetical protein